MYTDMPAEVEKMLNLGYSEAYIEAVLYGKWNYKHSMNEIVEQIKINLPYEKSKI